MFNWAKAFKDDRESAENEHDRRRRTSITPGNIRRVEELFLRDRRMNVLDISTEKTISTNIISRVYQTRTSSIAQNSDVMGF